MSEIEKMYENANIKAKEYCDRDSDACMACCPEWENRQDCWKYKSVMPPFTAEKQLELIKWLGKLDGKLEITCTYNKEKFIFNFYFNRKTDKNPDPKYAYSNFLNEDIEILIANTINNLWQDLTEEEKQQIKEILNE